MPADKLDNALDKLNRLSLEEQMAVLDKIEQKRRTDKFILYFQPWQEQIEVIAKFTDDIKIMGLLGGNRSGKTILGAFLAVAWGLG